MSLDCFLSELKSHTLLNDIGRQHPLKMIDADESY